MSAQPTCSVIIPTRGRPRPLRSCLEAIIRQDYPSTRFEVIVADDGDGVDLAPLRNRVECGVVRSDGRGPAAARNAAAAVASGDLLAFTDDDCEPEPGWLTALAASRHETVAGVGGRTVNGLPQNGRSRFSQLVISAGYAHNNSDQGDARFFASNNLAVRADAFAGVGGFDVRFRTSEDRDLCDRLVVAGGRLAYDEQAVVWHFHEMSLRAFWRQQRDYGRGARAYHAAYAARHGGTRVRLEPRFYGRLLAEAWQTRSSLTDGVEAAALFGVWAAANAVGYARGPLPT